MVRILLLKKEVYLLKDYYRKVDLFYLSCNIDIYVEVKEIWPKHVTNQIEKLSLHKISYDAP